MNFNRRTQDLIKSAVNKPRPAVITNRIITTQPVNQDKIFKISESEIYATTQMEAYKSAQQLAISKTYQDRTMLYDMYSDMLINDSTVVSLLDKRMDNINNKSIVLTDANGTPVKDYQYFLEAPKFRQFMKDILLSKFWGCQVFGFDRYLYDGKLWFTYATANHKHIDPYNKVITKRQETTDVDVKWDEGVNAQKYLFVGDENDLGLFNHITKLSLANRLGMFLYGKYLHIASDNFTTIEKQGSVSIEQMQKLMEVYGDRTGGGIADLTGMGFKQHNQSSSQQNDLFEGWMQYIQEQMSILILGQTMTSSDGSSRAQAEVHVGEQDDKFNADEQLILDVLNYEFKDYLNIWFKDINTTQMRFSFKPKTSVEIKNKIALYTSLQQLGIVWTDEELRNKFKDII